MQGDACFHGGFHEQAGDLPLSSFPLLGKQLGTLGSCDWGRRVGEQLERRYVVF